jgi:hypothetical protein
MWDSSRVIRASDRKHAVQKVLRWLEACVPVASAEAAALFRIVFMIGVVAFFALSTVGAGDVPSDIHRRDLGVLQRLFAGPFVAHPPLVDWLRAWLLVSGILVVVGLWTRWSYIAFVYGALAWGAVRSLRYGYHPFTTLLVALVMLVVARWADRWSLDSWLRTRRGAAVQTQPSREYGYAVWVPGLVLGIALAAAALYKLRLGGVGWILNGTVKYHFLTDAANAPVPWGRYIGQHHSLAVLLSLGTIVIEALTLPAVVSHVFLIRAAAGVSVLGLLIGFYLFQGLFWPGWWLLLLSFLPWNALAERGVVSKPVDARAPERSLVGSAQLLAITILVVQQMGASALSIEGPPLISAYDMYAGTHDSQASYERAATEYWLLATLDDGEDSRCRLSDFEGPHVASALRSGYAHPAVQAVVGRCYESPASLRTIRVETRRTVVDWDNWQIVGKAEDTVAGPVAVTSPNP